MLKTCQIAVSKPNRNSLWRFGSAREQFRSPTERLLRPLRIAVSKPNNRNSLWRFGSAKASSERQSKAAGKVLRVLRVLRGAENVPDSSFEAQ